MTATPRSATGNGSEYVPLGMFRLFLAFLVYLGHGLAPFFQEYQGIGLQTAGVAVFFVVSGYVIASAYYQFYQNHVPQFLLNRFLRIFPPFWGCYALALLGHAVLATPDFAEIGVREVAGTAVILGGPLGLSHLLLVPHAWTLAVELQFYVAAAIIFVVLQKLGRPRLAVWMLAAGAVAAYGFILIVGGHQRFFGALQYGPLFALGAVAFAIHWKMVSPRLGWTLVAALALLCLHEYDYYLGFNRSDNPLRPQAMVFFLAVTAVFLWAATGTVTKHTRFARLDRRAGALTYHLYLAHLPVLALLEEAGLYHGPLGFAAGFVLSIAATLVLERLTDKPISVLRDRIRGKKLI